MTPRPNGLRRLRGALGEGENLPLALGLQGLALGLLAFWLAPISQRPAASVGVSGSGEGAVPVLSTADLPTDLAAERIPLPDAPRRDEAPREGLPDEKPQEPDRPAADEKLHLAALRVANVLPDRFAPVRIGLGLPEAPDRLEPDSISRTRFGEGELSAGGRRTGEQWGDGGRIEGDGRTGGSCGRHVPPPPPVVIIEGGFGVPGFSRLFRLSF